MVSRIYHCVEDLATGDRLFLNEDASHHLATVLRRQVGEVFVLFGGKDKEYQVEICDIRKKKVEVKVLTIQSISRESPLNIHLAQGIAKGDRWLFSLQKAVELGVEQITPLWTQHVAYKWEKKIDEKKIAQWQSIIISACEQSGRTRVPVLNPIQTFSDFLQSSKVEERIILHPNHGQHWRELKWHNPQKVIVLIGPEGGFSDEEYALAMNHGVQGMTLGPRVLRTETAVVSALTILQAQYGDL